MEYLKKHVEEAKEMQQFCEEKKKKVKETKNLPFHKRVITLIGDYAQNLGLPHVGDE